MGLRAAFTDPAFGHDAAGHSVFYPHGGFSDGYVIEPPSLEGRLRRFIGRWSVALLGAIAVMAALDALAGPDETWVRPATVLIGVVGIAAYEVAVRRYVAGLARATGVAARSTLAERIGVQARAIGRRWLLAGAFLLVSLATASLVSLVGLVLAAVDGTMGWGAVAVWAVITLALVGAVMVPLIELGALGLARSRIVALAAGSAVLVLTLWIPLGMAGVPLPGMLFPLGGATDDTDSLPAVMEEGFPHEDPALEDLMPDFVDGRSLKVWSARGEHALEVGGDGPLGDLIAAFGASAGDVALATSGRWQESDPGNWAFGYAIDGVSGHDVRKELVARMTAEPDPIPLASVVIGSKLVDGYAEEGGAVYVYSDDRAAFVIVGVTVEAAQEMLAGTAAMPDAYVDTEAGVAIDIPPDWAVLAPGNYGDGRTIASLEARHPELASAILDLASSIENGDASVVALRSTTEESPPALQVMASVDCGSADAGIDGDALAAGLAEAYGLAAPPAHRAVTLPAGDGWELRWTGARLDGADGSSDFLVYAVSDGPSCAQVWFVTTAGRMPVYEPSFATIVSSLRLLRE